MQIPIAKILPPLPTATTTQNLLQTLKPGQILHGTALSENVDGAMQLRIGVARLTAQTTLSVKPGQSLLLQVEKSGDLPELRVLTLPSQKTLAAMALKNALPRQQPLPQLFQALNQTLAKPDSPGNPPLPPPVRQAVEQLMSQVVRINDPEFKAILARALSMSGNQTESLLLNGTMNPQDLKLNLLRLIALVRNFMNPPAATPGGPQSPAPPPGALPQTAPLTTPPTPSPTPNPASGTLPGGTIPGQPSAPQAGASADTHPTVKLLLDLFKHLDGAVARIQTNQLHSLVPDDAGRPVWQFELPIRQDDGVDLFQFRITPEAQRGEKGQSTGWRLTLHMNLSPLGPMKVQLQLVGEQVSTVIWSESPATSQRVAKHLDTLRRGLESAGLEVTKLASFQGSAENEQELPSDHILLNEKA
ncbi:MAG: flagellar hook-length control protein FliK [Candidatus Thiodiazotropha sp.]